MQSLPADSTGGPRLQADICILDACPSSLLAAPSYLFRPSLSSFLLWIPFTPSHNIPSTYRNYLVLGHVFHSIIFIYVIVIYISFHLESTCNRHGTRSFEPFTTPIKYTCGLFVFAIELQLLFHFSFPRFFTSSFCLFSYLLALLHTKWFQMEGNKLKHHNKIQQEKASAHTQGK